MARRKKAQSEEAVESQPMRLQKLLASAGYGSRRHCEEYVLAGRVAVDGKVVTDLGIKVDPAVHKVKLDGEVVRPEVKKYYLLNKPTGYLCTNNDPSGRPRAIDLVPQDGPRLFTVGRLDENSQGLILITNDGAMANRLAHPRYEVHRKYRVHVAGNPTPETLKQLHEGVYFSDGLFRCSNVKWIKSRGKSAILELGLQQGQNREIRRLLAKVGHKVMSLERVVFGPLKLGRLASGKFRPLRNSELDALRDLLTTSPKPTRSNRGKRRAATKGTRRSQAKETSSGRKSSRGKAASTSTRGKRSTRSSGKPRQQTGTSQSRKRS